jgi:transposase
MEKLPDLKQLSNEAKEALIVDLWEKIQKLSATLATHEPKPKPEPSPKKTSKNSSIPPSKGFKPNIKPSKIEGSQRQKSLGRAGGGRQLHSGSDQTIIAQLKNCPECGEKVITAVQKLQSVYEKIELPAIRPIVTRIERYGGQCACCHTEDVVPVPLGMEPGSPFGSSIQSLVTYLRYTHAIRYERLSLIFGSVFGLKIPEGAIANLLGKVKISLNDQVSQILQRLWRAKLICSDETSTRVNGQNQSSRASGVINEVLGEHRRDIWVSDLFSAQKNHSAPQWQMCLAHQLRDFQYAIDVGDRLFNKLSLLIAPFFPLVGQLRC